MGQQADAIVEHSLLNCNPEYVPNGVAIIRGNPTFSGKNFASLGCPVLDHLAADGASLTGGQVAVVAVGQVDANLLSCLHLELVHCLTSLGNIDLIVVLHNDTPLSVLTESSAATIALPNLRRKHIDFFGKIALGACGWLPGSLEVRIWKNGDR